MTTSRRTMLKGALGVLGAGAVGSLSRKARAEVPTPHYLINIVRRGGWDSLWFHNAVPQAEYRSLIETARPIVNGQTFISGTSGNILAPYGASSLCRAGASGAPASPMRRSDFIPTGRPRSGRDSTSSSRPTSTKSASGGGSPLRVVTTSATTSSSAVG